MTEQHIASAKWAASRRNSILKNEAGELLKTKDQPKKRTGNEAGTNLAKLVKIIGGTKDRPKTNPKSGAGVFVENKASLESKLEAIREIACPN